MRVKTMKPVFGVAVAVLMAASMSFAKSHRIDVIYSTKIGPSTQLNPGTYKVRLIQNGSSSKLVLDNRDGRKVAQVPVKVKMEAKKNPYTEVDYNKVAQNEHVITAIRLGGWSEEFVP